MRESCSTMYARMWGQVGILVQPRLALKDQLSEDNAGIMCEDNCYVTSDSKRRRRRTTKKKRTKKEEEK